MTEYIFKNWGKFSPNDEYCEDSKVHFCEDSKVVIFPSDPSISKPLSFDFSPEWQPDNSLTGEILSFFKRYDDLFIDNETEVIGYLMRDSIKLSNYFKIIIKIILLNKEYFSNESQIVMLLNNDPESDDVFLKFYLRLNEYPDDFYISLSRLREEYYEDLLRFDIWLLVTSDFNPIVKRER